MEYINFQHKKIAYRTSGKGKHIVLIHGFMESSTIWENFELELAKQYQVTTIDLPGHGLSDSFDKTYEIPFMAKSVKSIISHLNITQFTLIGHSMGGYVALDYLSNHPEDLSGLVLLHSTPFADSQEKKKGRDAVITRLKNGELNQIINEHFPKVFATKNTPEFSTQINTAIVLAQKNMSANDVIRSLEGMKNRKDYNNVLSQAKTPFLYIQGAHDNFIPNDSYLKISKPKNTKLLTLQNSGHAGFIEELDVLLETIKQFVK